MSGIVAADEVGPCCTVVARVAPEASDGSSHPPKTGEGGAATLSSTGEGGATTLSYIPLFYCVVNALIQPQSFVPGESG